MAFLDNSGDIILDAVLTDTGRYRLAKGDGSFRIAKFALGDDEIDYSLYNSLDSRGSAYYDLEILNTPILEAFTDNAASLKSKLLSIPRNDLLYLPVIKLADEILSVSSKTDLGVYCVAVDEATKEVFTNPDARKGVFYPDSVFAATIVTHQGLDTTAITWKRQIDSDLKETQYIVEIDNRLGKINNSTDNKQANYSFVDDDQIATYYFTLGEGYVESLNLTADDEFGDSPVAGPRGSSLKFKIAGTLELEYSTFLFDQLGSTIPSVNSITNSGNGFRYIDTNVRITGATTGYRIDIPVRFIKAI